MSLTWGEEPSAQTTLRRLHLSDVPDAVALTQAVGWGTSAAGWARVITWAGRDCWCIVRDDRIIATTMAVNYGPTLSWISMVLTHPDYQRQGLGQRLMTIALDALRERGVQHIMLDATPEGRPLYEKLGFRTLYNVEIWSGRASSYLGARARPLVKADIPAIVALDEAAFGVARGRVIRRLLQDYPHYAWVDEDDDGSVVGFIMAQDNGGLMHIGPWIARDPWSAEKLLRTALSVFIGRDVRVDIPDRNTRATAFAHGSDLHYERHCLRMILGEKEPLETNVHQYYGAAATAIG